MKYKTILFDFDGTLADSESLMIDSINALASEFGFTPIMPQELPSLRMISMRHFIQRRLRIPLWRIWRLLKLEKRSKVEYAKRSGGLRMIVGMPEVLSFVRERGAVVGVISSAPRVVVEHVLSQHGIRVDILRAGIGTFGKSRAITSALRERDIKPTDTVYVGDELRDIDACSKAGIAMFGVAWGLNDAQVLHRAGLTVASTPQELLGMLA